LLRRPRREFLQQFLSNNFVTLAAGHYSYVERKVRGQNEYKTHTYITIDGRSFSKDAAVGTGHKTWRCTSRSRKGCNMSFRLEDDGDNQYDKAVFDENVQHSK
jgi:hypothetical protein